MRLQIESREPDVRLYSLSYSSGLNIVHRGKLSYICTNRKLICNSTILYDCKTYFKINIIHPFRNIQTILNKLVQSENSDINTTTVCREMVILLIRIGELYIKTMQIMQRQTITHLPDTRLIYH